MPPASDTIESPSAVGPPGAASPAPCPPHPLAAAAERYWVRSREPLTALVFVAPLLVIYEAGVLLLGPQAIRNGADVWLRTGLDRLGLGPYFLLPALTVALLLAWHHTTGRPWRFSRAVVWGMAAECVLLGYCLRGILLLQAALLSVEISAPGIGEQGRLASAIGYLGAGLYEEVLFRLILLPAATASLLAAGVAARPAVVAAVVSTSLVFSAAHYVGPYGDPFLAFSFTFRFLAGVFFATLFIYRGFGIAAGAHATYDLLVGLA